MSLLAALYYLGCWSGGVLVIARMSPRLRERWVVVVGYIVFGLILVGVLVQAVAHDVRWLALSVAVALLFVSAGLNRASAYAYRHPECRTPCGRSACADHGCQEL